MNETYAIVFSAPSAYLDSEQAWSELVLWCERVKSRDPRVSFRALTLQGQRVPKVFVDRFKRLGWEHSVLPSRRRKSAISFSVENELDEAESLLGLTGYRAIVFQDVAGLGFYAIRSKKTGVGFSETSLLISVTGPTSFLQSQNRAWSTNPLHDIQVSFLERYCVENADGILSPSDDILAWFAFNGWATAPDTDFGSGKTEVKTAPPMVSLCMAHFNHGRFLPEALASIASNNYPNFEVIVVDDASTDAVSVEVLRAQEVLYSSRHWTFIRRSSNEGPQACRNFAASQANGELLIFVDADNRAGPTMISDFVRAMRRPIVDSMSCWFAVKSDEEMNGHRPTSRIAKPLGACLDFGWVTNVFGDTNFCVRRDVFEKLGGFKMGFVKGVEDWDFLMRLTLAGYGHDVCPKVLYEYRELPASLSRSTNHDVKYRAILASFSQSLPPHMRRLVFDYFVPAHKILSRKEHRAAQFVRRLLSR